MKDERYLTTDEVVDRTRLARSTIYKLAATGEIPCQRLRRRLLFPEEQLENWIRNGGEAVRTTTQARR
jgi:putative molybdopterin biosynthesis protein